LVSGKKAVETLLGPQAFSLGVVYGAGESIVVSVVDLLGLMKTLVLADVADSAFRQADTPLWKRALDLAKPGGITREIAGMVGGQLFKNELEAAQADWNVLIASLRFAMQNPSEVLGSIGQTYVDKWKRFEELIAKSDLKSRFEAGKIFGEVLLEVLGLFASGAGLAKLATKIPDFARIKTRLGNAAKGLKTKLAPKPKNVASASSARTSKPRLETAPENEPNAASKNPTPTEARSGKPTTEAPLDSGSQATKSGGANSGLLRSPSELMGVEPASAKLLDSIASKRSLVIAKPGSEELRMLEYFGAEASVGGAKNSSIILRENPSKAAALEEFPHGTQSKLGIVDRLGTSGFGSAETHVKDFMIRHEKMLGLSGDDIRILKILRDKGL
jgi:hypothetical protein